MKTPGVLLLLWSALVVVAAERGGLHVEATDAAAASTQQSYLSEFRAAQRQMIAQMAEQREELRLAKAQIEELKSGAVRPSNVAFSTSFSVKTDKHIGPLKTDTTLLFDLVFTNVGNAYNTTTGLFTAPLKGVYQFNYHIFAGGDQGAGHGAGAKLFKNKDEVVTAYNHVAPHDVNTSQSVILQLQEGDTVSLLLEAGWWVAAYTGHLTTFSGHLLFAVGY
ncbi:complement C1q-like protein 4 isoform X1 [Alosa sapidissima]|uniref:complement C1q-like protein 4 isoform X1 n=1 Tax=Alosa sapidissima TaxID=34773 RepID=UPI001C094AA8|nr:complement C1q-like protein 4 isoform X1 [Alosa sapidissima]